MRTVTLVKFEEIVTSLKGNTLEIPKRMCKPFVFEQNENENFEVEVFEINTYLDEKMKRKEFAITKSQEEIMRAFIYSKYNVMQTMLDCKVYLYERKYLKEKDLKMQKEIQDLEKRLNERSNELSKKTRELETYKNPDIFQRVKYFFTGSV